MRERHPVLNKLISAFYIFVVNSSLCGYDCIFEVKKSKLCPEWFKQTLPTFQVLTDVNHCHVMSKTGHLDYTHSISFHKTYW
jgi:hypothetical protein